CQKRRSSCFRWLVMMKNGGMIQMKQGGIGLVLYGLIVIPPVSAYLESVMITHMLVQMPLLVVAGWLIGQIVIEKGQTFFDRWNANGVPGILLVVFITMYWMLPRAMDEALVEWYMEWFKFIAL